MKRRHSARRRGGDVAARGKDMPPAARQAMAESFQRMLDRREIVFTGERNAKGKPIYRSMIYEGDRDPRREN